MFEASMNLFLPKLFLLTVNLISCSFVLNFNSTFHLCTNYTWLKILQIFSHRVTLHFTAGNAKFVKTRKKTKKTIDMQFLQLTWKLPQRKLFSIEPSSLHRSLRFFFSSQKHVSIECLRGNFSPSRQIHVVCIMKSNSQAIRSGWMWIQKQQNQFHFSRSQMEIKKPFCWAKNRWIALRIDFRNCTILNFKSSALSTDSLFAAALQSH